MCLVSRVVCGAYGRGCWQAVMSGGLRQRRETRLLEKGTMATGSEGQEMGIISLSHALGLPVHFIRMSGNSICVLAQQT